jgi:hypothetical protein
LNRPSFNQGFLGVFLLICFASGAYAQTVAVTNANLALTINGKAVFGMAVSPGPAVGAMAATGIDALDEFRSGGIQFYRIPVSPTWKATSNTLNSAMIATNQAALDWCATHGMYSLLNLNDLSYFTSTDTNTPALLETVVNMWKNHPGLGMWKNKDEAWWGGTSEADLQRGYDIIRTQDTNHLVEQTHAPRGQVSDLQPYNNAASVLMVDNYPVVVPAGSASNPPVTNTQVSQFGDWTAELAQVANGSRTFWMVEQIAFSGTAPPSHVLVFPTFQQERFMTYQAIVNGARGLMFFGGNLSSTLTNATDAALGWNWSFGRTRSSRSPFNSQRTRRFQMRSLRRKAPRSSPCLAQPIPTSNSASASRARIFIFSRPNAKAPRSTRRSADYQAG